MAKISPQKNVARDYLSELGSPLISTGPNLLAIGVCMAAGGLLLAKLIFRPSRRRGALSSHARPIKRTHGGALGVRSHMACFWPLVPGLCFRIAPMHY